MNEHTFDELFDRYPARFRPVSSLVPMAGAGGLSGARLWRFSAEQGSLLLRAWPLNGPGRAQLEQVHRWLASTAELGFVPLPIRDRGGRSLQEWHQTLWEIAPWLPGQADSTPPSDDERLRRAFTGLAAFHERLAGQQMVAISPGLRQRHQEILGLLRGGFRSLEIAIHRGTDAEGNYQTQALGWLALAQKAAPILIVPLGRLSIAAVPVQPVLRDARPEHFLFEGNRLSGLIDFGAMGVESVAADLGRLIGDWLGGDATTRREAITAYEKVRPLAAGEIRLIDAFEKTTALLIGERWARWHFIENRGFAEPQAVTKGLERGLSRVNRLVGELADTKVTF